MIFYDKNGTELKIGDHIVPDEGRELVLISQGFIEDEKEEVIFGQQVADMRAFSYMTQENLSKQWTKLDI